MPSQPDPTRSPPVEVDLDVRGSLPSALSGRLAAVGSDGVIHLFHLRRGQVSHLVRALPTGATVRDLVAFEGAILAVSESSAVHDLGVTAGPPYPVDLAGPGRRLVAGPKCDTATGELHLVAVDPDGGQWHVVVGAGALTRRSRSISSARVAIHGLALGGDHVVFVADGAVGVTPGHRGGGTAWIATGAAAPRPVHAFRRHDDVVVLLALTPSLEQWILHLDGAAMERKVLDPTARRFARTSRPGPDGSTRSVWTAGDETIDRHDAVESSSGSVSLTPQVPGDFVVVPGAAGTDTADEGWFVGLVYGAADSTTDLQVIDAADLAQPAVATIRFPQPTPRGLRCEWLPAAPQ